MDDVIMHNGLVDILVTFIFAFIAQRSFIHYRYTDDRVFLWLSLLALALAMRFGLIATIFVVTAWGNNSTIFLRTARAIAIPFRYLLLSSLLLYGYEISRLVQNGKKNIISTKEKKDED
jgi:hypothetical protein